MTNNARKIKSYENDNHLNFMETKLVFLLYFSCVIGLNGKTGNNK